MLRIHASCIALNASLLVALAAAGANDETDKQEKRDKIDDMATEALQTLFDKHPDSSQFYESSYGYAVFRSIKVAIGISGGSGSGVAVNRREEGERTYMRMATGGLGIGLGGQKYSLIFLFKDKETFDEFINEGWQGEAHATAVAGTAGKNAASSFDEGVVIYQLTKKGLMANADVSGTKFWINNDLNREE